MLLWAKPTILFSEIAIHRYFVFKNQQHSGEFVSRRDELSHSQWMTLLVFSLYRLCIAVILLTLYVFDFGFFNLGQHSSILYNVAIGFYLVFSILLLFSVHHQYPGFNFQANLQVIFDIVILTLLLYASQSVYSSNSILFGFGILLNAVIAGGGLLTAGRISLFFAAIASIAVLVQHFFSDQAFTLDKYQEIGILGATFFATATLGFGLSHRIKKSEALASQRGLDLAKLEMLNEKIVSNMHSGIIVVDENDRVRLVNRAAWYLLGIPERPGPQLLSELSLVLANFVTKWRQRKGDKSMPGQVMLENQGVLSQISAITDQLDDPQVCLILLEDAARLTQQAQQMKLASLGRLTASIAHEIRNPLGAISHAEQLLEESPRLNKEDLRLTEIIREHSERMNHVIENVLQLSRRKEAVPKVLNIKSWLEDFISTFKLHDLPHSEITLHVEPENLEIFIDPSQLYQILSNLCENGLHYSFEKVGKPMLILKAGITVDGGETMLEIIDFGQGIDPSTTEVIFEPFFTTKTGGTGLGLYIAKELCEANSASLQYFPRERGGSCFRITFHQLDNIGD